MVFTVHLKNGFIGITSICQLLSMDGDHCLNNTVTLIFMDGWVIVILYSHVPYGLLFGG